MTQKIKTRLINVAWTIGGALVLSLILWGSTQIASGVKYYGKFNTIPKRVDSLEKCATNVRSEVNDLKNDFREHKAVQNIQVEQIQGDIKNINENIKFLIELELKKK